MSRFGLQENFLPTPISSKSVGVIDETVAAAAVVAVAGDGAEGEEERHCRGLRSLFVCSLVNQSNISSWHRAIGR
jgi:hypothetical protein